MPALDSVFVVGSRLKPFKFKLEHEDRTPIDLTGHTVTLTMYKDVDGVAKITAAACVIDDATSGEGHYAWTAGDVDTPGDFWVYIKRTAGGGLWADLPEGPDGLNRGRGCKVKFVTAT